MLRYPRREAIRLWPLQLQSTDVTNSGLFHRHQSKGTKVFGKLVFRWNFSLFLMAAKLTRISGSQAIFSNFLNVKSTLSLAHPGKIITS